jgi:dTDP-4-dehydrorhamnose reductase
MLGQEVVRALNEYHRDAPPVVLATDREVDITDPAAVDQWWASSGRVDWVVNCAAYTAVDRAEEEQGAAMRLNREGPAVLAAAATARGAAVLHLSTDYVFSGDATAPYLPEDPPAPQSVYGRTKQAGEDAVRRNAPRHIILRTAWLYGAGGPNFVRTMVRLMNAGNEFGVVADQRGLPTWSADLARTIAGIVFRQDPTWGTYHFTNAGATPEEDHGGISWFEFARQIHTAGTQVGVVKGPVRFSPLRTDQYPTAARRPAYSVLDSSATEQAFAVSRPEWRASLGAFLSTMETQQ